MMTSFKEINLTDILQALQHERACVFSVRQTGQEQVTLTFLGKRPQHSHLQYRFATVLNRSVHGLCESAEPLCIYMPATAIQSVRPLPSRDGFFQCSAHILARPNGTAKRRRLSVGRLGPSRDLPARGRVLPVPPPWRGFRAGWSKQRNARYRFWMAYAGIEEHLWLVEFSNIPLSLGSGKCGSPDQPSIPLPLLSDIDIGSARRSISPSGSQHQRHTLIDDEFSGRACRFRESRQQVWTVGHKAG